MRDEHLCTRNRFSSDQLIATLVYAAVNGYVWGSELELFWGKSAEFFYLRDTGG
jgi:hypothetical protein